MKKEYTNPTIEIVIIEANDIITSSTFDPYEILSSENADDWYA